MKKKLSQFSAFNQSLIEQPYSNNQNIKAARFIPVLAMVILSLFSANFLKAQTTITYLPSAATFNATTKGYEMTGVGTYFRDNGSSSGNITPNNGVTCGGNTPAFPTGSATFFFLPAFGDISKITVYATGTGSNRVLLNISTSATQAGTYTVDAGATSIGTIASGVCGSIEITPSAPIAIGNYIKFVFSGNLNITAIDFLTGASTPAVTTNATTAISCTSLTLNGSIDNDGGFTPVTRGFVYSTTNNDPTIGDPASISVNAGTGTGNFTTDLSGLTQATIYYIKAWGTNSAGTAYGAVQTVTTAVPGPATVTTTAASNITSFSVATGGEVTADGCTPVTGRGIVWGTSPAPALPSANSTTNGSGLGIFATQVTGLAASTTYYLRAYAINGSDTAYGNEITFITSVPQPALFASVSAINFPATTIGTSSTLTYTLTGSTLDGTPISITAPPGFTVSPATITYTGNSFTQVVTITFTPTVLGTASGTITQTGGGATGIYIIDPTVSGNGKLPVPAVTSNVGNDFWLGFGYHAQMKDVNNGRTRADLSLYVSNPSSTTSTVIVEMPGLGGGFVTQTQDIAPGGFYEFFGFPLGDGTAANTTNAPDARLYYTGISNRSIHVYSANGVPVAAWLYSYTTNDAAAGSLIFPTNTWNTAYTVQTIGGGANGAGSPNSFFFVIAEEDSTQIEITPTGDILDSVAISTIETSANIRYSPTSGAFTVTLNRGQIFNALSPVVGGFGVDLSGSTIRSINCKKIAVFAGNGRNGIGSDVCNYTNGAGTDNLVQQMFPKVAWGNKYYTTPTKHMEYNTYRITVDSATTKVWLNDPQRISPLTGYNSVNKFYEIYTNHASLIESDKPVSITQFISSESCASNELIGNNGKGDPEMIILSPAAQAINKVTVFSPTIKNGNIGGSYINVVIPKAGISSFKLDLATDPAQMVDTGSSSYIAGVAFNPADLLIPIADAFLPYAADTSYYWAKFKVAAGEPHTLESVIPFNAIAYGTAQGESYGFNAGTQVNNLTTPLIIENPYGGPSQVLKTCRGNTIKFSAVLPYQTNRITYSFGSSPIMPNSDTSIAATSGNLAFDSSFIVSGQTFYVYRLSTPYSFSAAGNYTVQITSFDPTSTDACLGGSDKTINYTVEVIEGVTADFLIDYNSCASDTVQLTDQSNGLGYAINQWHWSYNNGTTPLAAGLDTIQNPRLANPASNTAGNYTLRAVNAIGCFADTTKTLPVAAIPAVTFSALTGVCTSNPSFSLTGGSPATATGVGTGVYSGPGVSGGNFDASVAGAGTHTITYTYTTQAGCSASATQTIVVSQAATLTIAAVAPVCADAAPVTLVPSLAGGVFTGPGVTGNTFNPAAAGTGNIDISYSIASNTCSVPATLQIVVNPLPTGFSAGNNVEVVFGQPATLMGTGPATNTYLWSPASVVNPTSLVTVSTATESTPYTLTATTGAGCTATDEVLLTLTKLCVDPPKVFTPNSDGFYDKWVVINGSCTKEVKVDVYNRWGGLVYNNDHYNNEWDGTVKGKPLPDGTYYYIVKALLVNGGISYFRGNVTIMR